MRRSADPTRLHAKFRWRRSFLLPGLILLTFFLVSRVLLVTRIDENSFTLHSLSPSVAIKDYRNINNQLMMERYLQQSGYLTPDRATQVSKILKSEGIADIEALASDDLTENLLGQVQGLRMLDKMAIMHGVKRASAHRNEFKESSLKSAHSERDTVTDSTVSPALVTEPTAPVRNWRDYNLDEIPIPEGYHIKDTAGLKANIDYLNKRWLEREKIRLEQGLPRAALITTAAVSLEAVIREVIPWLHYHVEIDVAKFIIFYDGNDGFAKCILKSILAIQLLDISFEERESYNEGNWKQINAPDFKLITFEDGNWTRVDEKGRRWQRVGGRPCPTDEFGRLLPADKNCYGVGFTMSRLDHWLPDFGYGRPGNYKLMIKQSFNLQEGIHIAQEKGYGWIIHMDVDELFFPGPTASRGGAGVVNRVPKNKRNGDGLASALDQGEDLTGGNNTVIVEEGSVPDLIPPGFTISRVLSEIPPNKGQVQFLNNEAKIESFDVKYRFEELVLFARNGHFRTEDEKKLNKPNEKGMVGGASGFLVYTNGKAGARVHRELTQWGAHAFKSDGKPFTKMVNEDGSAKHMDHPDAAILHYPYARYEEMREKAHRSCPFLEEAKKGNEEAVKPCFVIEMDRKAFMASATGDEQVMRDFYEKNIIIKNKEHNIREGLLINLYEPKNIFRKIRRELCPECFQD